MRLEIGCVKYALLGLGFKFLVISSHFGFFAHILVSMYCRNAPTRFFSACLGPEEDDVMENHIACKVDVSCVCVAYNTQAGRF